MVSTQDSESCNPSSNLGGTYAFFFCRSNVEILGAWRFAISWEVTVPCGLVVRIRRFHRRGRGSIPRMGEIFFLAEGNAIVKLLSNEYCSQSI